MLADEVGNFRNPRQSGANRLVLVERHGDAFARAADGNSGEHLAVFDASGECVAEVGVVATFLRMGAVILVFQPLFIQIFLHKLLQGKASVVAGEANHFLFFHRIAVVRFVLFLCKVTKFPRIRKKSRDNSLIEQKKTETNRFQKKFSIFARCN